MLIISGPGCKFINLTIVLFPLFNAFVILIPITLFLSYTHTFSHKQAKFQRFNLFDLPFSGFSFHLDNILFKLTIDLKPRMGSNILYKKILRALLL